MPHSEFRAGIRAELPIALGGVPFGMIYGVLARAAGLPPLLAQAMSAIVFAGSAQFIGAQLFAAATPAGIIVFTTFIVNLRHLLYSASTALHLKHLSPLWQWLLAYFLTDEVYAVTIIHYERNEANPARKHLFLLGAGLTGWGFWQTSTAAGIFLGAQVPSSWSLDFTLALTFIGLVVPALCTRPEMVAAAVAGVVAVLGTALPYKLGLIGATLAGIMMGLLLERFDADGSGDERE